LKSKSESANSFIVTIKGTETQEVRDKLGTIIESSKVTIVSDKAPTVTARVFAKKTDENSELGQAIYDVATQNSWQVSEIRKEEGRLDDVFRDITRTDT